MCSSGVGGGIEAAALRMPEVQMKQLGNGRKNSRASNISAISYSCGHSVGGPFSMRADTLAARGDAY